MRRKAFVLAALAAVGLTLAGGIAFAARDRAAVGPWGLREANVTGPARATAHEGEVVVTARLVFRQFKFVDAAPGFVGDWLTFAGSLVDGNDVVGSITIECTVHFAGRAHCEGTAAIGGHGKVSVQGTTGRYPFSLAALGATGEFRNHIGTMKVFNPEGPDEAIVITLVDAGAGGGHRRPGAG